MKNGKDKEDQKPDIKHDTMEFSASTEGDDKLDFDDEGYEEEEVTAEEIGSLEDEPDNDAMALNAVETDSLEDEDILPEEDWIDDTKGEEA
jgi:hypothetical protein